MRPSAIFNLAAWRVIRGVVVIALSLAVLGFLLRDIAHSPASLAALADVEARWIGTAVLWMSAAFGLSVLKWWILVDALGHRLPLRRALVATLISWPFATVTPSRAGDLIRTLVVRAEVPLLRGQASVIFDRLLDIQSLVLLAIVGGVWLQMWSMVAGLSALVLAFWGMGLVLVSRRVQVSARLRSQRVRIFVSEILQAIADLLRRWQRLGLAGGLSLATWICVQMMFDSLCRGLGLQLSLVDALALWPLATLIGLVPITLSGMGTRDLAFVGLVGQIHPLVDARETMLLATLGYTLVSAWLFALVGAPFALTWLWRASLGQSAKVVANESSPDVGNN